MHFSFHVNLVAIVMMIVIQMTINEMLIVMDGRDRIVGALQLLCLADMLSNLLLGPIPGQRWLAKLPPKTIDGPDDKCTSVS